MRRVPAVEPEESGALIANLHTNTNHHDMNLPFLRPGTPRRFDAAADIASVLRHDVDRTPPTRLP